VIEEQGGGQAGTPRQAGQSQGSVECGGTGLRDIKINLVATSWGEGDRRWSME
jgi:hypothetical protein